MEIRGKLNEWFASGGREKRAPLGNLASVLSNALFFACMANSATPDLALVRVASHLAEASTS
jgi:hypothetical protein